MEYSDSKFDIFFGALFALIIGAPLLVGGYAAITSLSISDWKIVFGVVIGFGMIFFGLLFVWIATGFLSKIIRRQKRSTENDEFKLQTNN